MPWHWCCVSATVAPTMQESPLHSAALSACWALMRSILSRLCTIHPEAKSAEPLFVLTARGVMQLLMHICWCRAWICCCCYRAAVEAWGSRLAKQGVLDPDAVHWVVEPKVDGLAVRLVFRCVWMCSAVQLGRVSLLRFQTSESIMLVCQGLVLHHTMACSPFVGRWSLSGHP